MWMKDGTPLGDSIVIGSRRFYKPSPALLKRAGYIWVDPPEPEPVPIKYSTLKVIRALGDDWEYYRLVMEEAGILDQFFAANNLSSDDPVFQAFISQLPMELVSRLDECIWEG